MTETRQILCPPQVVTDRAAFRAALVELRAPDRSMGLVPTMGALHAGHLSLVESSVRQCDRTVVTIFVNPTQFGPQEDFSRYPRDLEGDLARMAPLGPDLVFAPDVQEIYRDDHATQVDTGGVARMLEGQFRPGHFHGVATVVLKLLLLAGADVVFFGQKDYQQAIVVRRMVHDLDIPVDVRICPIVRDADGLALSSRNAYLNASQRQQALTLSASLRHAERRVAEGCRDAATLIHEMREMITAAGDVRIDYVALVDPDTLAPIQHIDRRSVALLAVHVGATRLIDNTILLPP